MGRLTVLILVVGSVLLGNPALGIEEWRSLEYGRMTVYFRPQDEGLARELGEIGRRLLGDEDQRFSLRMDMPVTLYVASTDKEFRELTYGAVPDWGVGCAIPERSLIVIKSSRVAPAKTEPGEVIAHELAHIAAGMASGFAPYPRWFSEGFAQLQSKAWSARDEATLATSALFGGIFPLSELAGAFPYSQVQVNLAYIESHSAVLFLARLFGRDAVWAIIEGMGWGLSFEESFHRTTSISLEEFESMWMGHVTQRYRTIAVVISSALGWFLISLLFLVAWNVKRKRSRLKLAQMEMEQ
jgi:hypothetical protein